MYKRLHACSLARRIPRFRLLLSFTSGACAHAAAALGMVLCLGGDGHVAIEAARGADCTDLEAHKPRHADTALAADRGAAHCQDCIDIAIAEAVAAFPAGKPDGLPAAAPPDGLPGLRAGAGACIPTRPRARSAALTRGLHSRPHAPRPSHGRSPRLSLAGPAPRAG